MIFSKIDKPGCNELEWPKKYISLAKSFKLLFIGWLFQKMSPLSGIVSPQMHYSRVVLPIPFEPTTRYIFPYLNFELKLENNFL